MRALAVTGRITQLTRFRFVNCFLVQEQDGLTLVDTALQAAEQILAAAERLGAPIVRIALTHGHGDHVGSLDALKRALGAEVQVLMPEPDAQIHAGERPKTKGGWPKLATAPDVRFEPGVRIGSLEAVASPGHTSGHVSFLDTRDRTLIAGDVFTSYGGVAVSSRLHLRFPFAAMATADPRQNLESARALRALAPSLLLVGHGPAVPGPAVAMERAISRASR